METRFFFRFPCQGRKKNAKSSPAEIRAPAFRSVSESRGLSGVESVVWRSVLGPVLRKTRFQVSLSGEKKNAKSPPAELDFGGHDDFGVTVALRRSSGRGGFPIRKKGVCTISSMEGGRSYIYRRGVSKGINLLLWPRRGRGGTETMERRARKGHGRV